MIEQKNRMDPALTELLFLKNEVDFEFLWSCISKIRNESTQRKCMRGKIALIK